MKNTNDPERDMYVQLLLNYVRALLNSASVSPDCFSNEAVKGDDHAKMSTTSASIHTNDDKNEYMNGNGNRNNDGNRNGNRNNNEKEEHHKNGMINSERNKIADMITEEEREADRATMQVQSGSHVEAE